MKMNQHTLVNLNSEIKDMKARKLHFQLELKDLYMKFFKEKEGK